MIDEEVNKRDALLVYMRLLVYCVTEKITSLWLVESRPYFKNPFNRK